MENLLQLKAQILECNEDSLDAFIQDNISKLGRAGVALSFALFKSKPLEIAEFQYPLGNIIGGGKHGGGTDIQEFLISPEKAENIQDAIFTNAEAHRELKARLAKADPNFLGAKNDEGGWVCTLSTDKILDILSELSGDFGLRVGMDMAATSLWDDTQGRYVYGRQGASYFQSEQIEYVKSLIDTYNLFYVEDPLHEKDFEGFAELTKKAGDRCLICGDDLFVTNVELLQKGLKMGSCNSLIIKPNQIGTVGAARITADLAKSRDYKVVVSHRSAETEDATLARVALAFKGDFIKTGIAGGERAAKLNELIRLWRPGCKMVKP
jgi:enolase